MPEILSLREIIRSLFCLLLLFQETISEEIFWNDTSANAAWTNASSPRNVSGSAFSPAALAAGINEIVDFDENATSQYMVVLDGAGNFSNDDSSKVLLSTTSAYTQESTPAQEPRNFDTCACDLFVAACDVNCCCDRDCLEDDKSYFSECADHLNRQQIQGQACVDDGLIIRNSSSASTYRRSPNLLCLLYDNNPQRLVYSALSLLSAADFTSVWTSRASSGPFMPRAAYASETAMALNQTLSGSKVGDPVFMLPKGGADLVRLQIPSTTDFNTRCVSYRDVAYLKDIESACGQYLLDLSSQCTSLAVLDINHYLNISLLTRNHAADTSQDNSQNVGPMSLIAVPLQLSAIMRRDGDGLHQGFAFDPKDLSPFSPEFSNSSEGCRNVVSRVEYVITYDGSSVLSAEVIITLSTVNDSFFQTFSVKYVSARRPAESVKRSGNPGYLDGYPLLVAYVPEADSATNVTVTNIFLPRLAGTGQCQSGDGRPVLFGENVQMSCNAFVDLRDVSSDCQTLQDLILGVIRGEGNSPNYVATFGNGTTYDSRTWIPIFTNMSEAINHTTLELDICRNIVSALSIEVLYSNVGYVEFPQSKVAGVLLRFGGLQDVPLQCQSYGCIDQNSILIDVQISVTFTDLSTTPVNTRRLQHSSVRRVPADFSIPF